MTQTVAQEIAQMAEARENCIRLALAGREPMLSDDRTWAAEWTDRLLDIQNELPSGSGLDSGTTIDLDRTTGSKIVLHTAFHHMNDVGYYDGWTEHTITVTPTFTGITLRISGRNRNLVKEYLYEIFDQALGAEYTGS